MKSYEIPQIRFDPDSQVGPREAKTVFGPQNGTIFTKTEITPQPVDQIRSNLHSLDKYKVSIFV